MLSTPTISALCFRGAVALRRGRIVSKPDGPPSVSALFARKRAVLPLGSRHCSSNSSNTDSLVGVVAAQAATSKGTESASTQPTVFAREFSLNDRVALVSGGNGGIGLEAALGFLEAGARAVYCVDLPQEPSDAWRAAQRYASSMKRPGTDKAGRLEYVRGDVTDQKLMWNIAEDIGDKEKRLDVVVAAAGMVPDMFSCLDCPAEVFRKVLDVNTAGVLFTAQAAGRQMVRFGNGGSIILIASAGASVTIRDFNIASYGASKGAVVQLTRNMACELAPLGVRVNSLSPGWIHSPMTADIIAANLGYFEKASPIPRPGRPHEVRGAAVWLASDASSFCTGSNILVDGGLTAW